MENPHMSTVVFLESSPGRSLYRAGPGRQVGPDTWWTTCGEGVLEALVWKDGIQPGKMVTFFGEFIEKNMADIFLEIEWWLNGVYYTHLVTISNH
jgi:hypothetical protein